MNLWICESMDLSNHPSIFSIYPSIHPSIHPSICLSICLSIYLSIYCFVYLPIQLVRAKFRMRNGTWDMGIHRLLFAIGQGQSWFQWISTCLILSVTNNQQAMWMLSRIEVSNRVQTSSTQATQHSWVKGFLWIKRHSRQLRYPLRLDPDEAERPNGYGEIFHVSGLFFTSAGWLLVANSPGWAMFTWGIWSFIWLVVWNVFYFPIYIYMGNNHPNWLIFFRGVQTTNQSCMSTSYLGLSAVIWEDCTSEMMDWRSNAGEDRSSTNSVPKISRAT